MYFFLWCIEGKSRVIWCWGLLISPDQLSEKIFSWGLGSMYNNQVESYNILKACQLAKEVGFKSIQVFGDTELLIKMLNSNDLFNNSTLKLIPQRI